MLLTCLNDLSDRPLQILVTTGGASWLAESFMPAYLTCDGIDIVALHLYAPSDFNATALRMAISDAQAAKKMLMVQEWCVAPSSPAFLVILFSKNGIGLFATRTSLMVARVKGYQTLDSEISSSKHSRML